MDHSEKCNTSLETSGNKTSMRERERRGEKTNVCSKLTDKKDTKEGLTLTVVEGHFSGVGSCSRLAG